MVSAVINWFAGLPGSIWQWLCNVVSSLIQWKDDMVQKGVDAASGLINSIIDTISSLPDKMLSIGENIVRGIWDGITGMASWLKDKVSDFFSGFVDGIKDVLGIHSPSRLMRDLIGKNIVKGIGVGIELESSNLEKDVMNNLTGLTSKMRTAVDYETSRVSSSVIDFGNSLNSGSNVINNNENGITQNITITQPVKSPSETARAIKRAGRELAFG
jgi:phage-related protein